MKKIILLSMFIFMLSPLVGAKQILPLSEIFDSSSSANEIFWLFRLPRLLLAVFCGMILGVSGLVFQTIFRNPLTTPYTLGIASGASFGATLAIITGASVVFAPAVTCFAVAGALGTIGLILLISRYIKQSNSMLLMGVALSFFFASMMLFLTYVVDVESSFRSTRWLMGSLDIVGFDTVFIIAPFSIFALSVSLLLSKELDVLSTGEELAESRGVDALKIKRILFLCLSLTVGVCVSVIGPIGFVGLIVPHIVKSIQPYDHGKMILRCALISSSFLVFCDLISRIAAYPAELPIGIVTALIGTPFFMLYIFKSRL